MKVIDMHTHIFPEKVAAKATIATAEYFDLPEPPNHYGSAGELLEVLDRAGIGRAMVICRGPETFTRGSPMWAMRNMS